VVNDYKTKLGNRNVSIAITAAGKKQYFPVKKRRMVFWWCFSIMKCT